MTALPSVITPTLGKLIPRLASNHDGEVVATVAAIRQVLAANKLDWHDLAAALNPAGIDDDFHDVIAFCAMHAARLSRKSETLSARSRAGAASPRKSRLPGWMTSLPNFGGSDQYHFRTGQAKPAGLPVQECPDNKEMDKKPYTKHGFKDATLNPSLIRHWWTQWPDALIGVPTGERFVVVDVDLQRRPLRNGTRVQICR